MSSMKTKSCGFGCGTEIYWDDSVKRYKEVDTEEVHQCPNYVKGGIPKKETRWEPRTKPDYTATKPKENAVASSGKTAADNSFTYITGTIRDLQLQYEIISSLVQEAGGKIHGSQRGTDEEGKIDLLVYWEVPKGYKGNVNESFKQKVDRLSI